MNLRIRERKLGREHAVGLYWHGERLVEIDPRQHSRQYMNTLIHELLHHELPSLSERRVGRIAGRLSAWLWRKQFRRIEK